MDIKWLFLDFDNTCMATEHLALPALIARFNELYGEQLPQPLTVELFKEKLHGLAREPLCNKLREFYRIDIDCTALYHEREWQMMQLLQRSGGVEMAPNLLETLEPLAAQGVQLVFVSNNPIQRACAAMRCAQNGQGHRLARLFGANFFEAGDTPKPKPDVYLRAMAQLGAAPHSSCAVEDSPSGVLSAVAAGLRTFGYTGFSTAPAQLGAKLRAQGAAAVFSRWEDFPELIARGEPETGI